MTYRVLIVEDESVFARNVGTYLGRQGYDVQVADTAEQGLAAFERERPDLVLLDYRLGDTDGLDLLAAMRQRDEDARVVLMTGHGSVDVAVAAMKNGAIDFLTKPVALGRIKRLVERFAGERDGASQAPEPPLEDDLLVGQSPAMAGLRERINQIAAAQRGAGTPLPPPVLITGETGTGKELVARTLHRASPRASRPFVSVNCAALPAHLVEAELFGHERGAFTDAKSAKPGLLETADGGVLFLDEVGDLDLSVQSKLLRMLEERSVRRLGGVTERPVDVWILSATNRPLDQLVAEGAFRSDLLFRLNVLKLQTPPLRERGDDVLLLARHLLEAACQRWQRPALRLTEDAERALRRHAWPGNVRELRNVIEQAVVLGGRGGVDASHLGLADEPAAAPAAGGNGGFHLPAEGVDLEVLERELVLQALDRTEWNVTAAARLLGLTRDTMRYRIDKHGLRRSG